VLVVGLGPAGYTLAHYLLNEGFGVVGIDGLKIEPLPARDHGRRRRRRRARAAPDSRLERDLREPLDERVLGGLRRRRRVRHHRALGQELPDAAHLTLARARAAMYGGVRFGGTLPIDDAWALRLRSRRDRAGAGRRRSST
jgi:hypothetical protein